MTHRPARRSVVVIDEAKTRGELEVAVRDGGLPVRVASHASAALEVATAGTTAAAIVAIAVPGAAEVLRVLRDRDIPVIGIVAVSDLALAAAAHGAEVAALLTRPVEPMALRVAIDRAIELTSLRLRVRTDRELLRTLAHDVRANIATAVMVVGTVGDEASIHSRKFILARRALKRVELILDDALDVSELAPGGYGGEPRTEPDDALALSSERAAALVGEAADRLGPNAAERGVSLVSEVSVDFAASCDRHRIVAALERLGTRAMKRTPRGGAVRIVADCVDGRARFAVDHDVSSPSEIRGSDPERAKLDLGLAFAEAIAFAHGGELIAEGGKGYALELPLEHPSTISLGVARQEIPAAST